MKTTLLRALSMLALSLVTIVVLYPVVWVVRVALTEGATLATAEDFAPSLANFEAVLSHRGAGGEWLFGRQLWNSLVISTATTVVGVCLSVSAAYALSRMRFPGREGFLRTLLLSQMFPGVAVAVPLYYLLGKLGLLNTSTGLVLVYATTSVPFCAHLLKGYFDTIPKEIEEAAALDGASPGLIFWRIVLPLARPGIAVTALFYAVQRHLVGGLTAGGVKG